MLVVVLVSGPQPGIKPDVMRSAAMGTRIELAGIVQIVDQIAVEFGEERFHVVPPK